MALALISDFTGADENPLSEGGNWALLNSSWAAMQRISNATSGGSAAVCGAYWTPANFGPDLEAYITIVTRGGTEGLLFRIQGEGGAATFDGYSCHITGGQLSLQVWTNASNVVLRTDSGGTWANGDKIGLRALGSTLQGWQQKSGSSVWNLRITAVDTTYSAAGKVAMWVNTTTVRFDDFYAGGIEWTFGDVPSMAPIFGR